MARTVLIAESSAAFLNVLESTLPTLGFSVIGTTTETSEIVPIAQETRPDLLIFDLSLSRSNQTTIYSLKQQQPDLKILAIGFHEAIEEIIEEILKAGFDAFWNKADNRSGFLKALSILFPD